MEQTFGIISEGVTDQAIIEQILYAHFGNPDLDIRPLQPQRLVSNQTKGFASWTLIFHYCLSDDFREAFSDVDFVILQIDTDICHHAPFGIDAKRSSETVEAFILRVQERFVELWEAKWGADFCLHFFHRILFAVAVQASECWLLPLYAPQKKQDKLVGCLKEVEQAVKQSLEKNKTYPFYERLTAPYRKAKNLPSLWQANPSLDFFINRELPCKLCYHDYLLQTE